MSLPLQPTGNVYNAGAGISKSGHASQLPHARTHTHTRTNHYGTTYPRKVSKLTRSTPLNSVACIIVILSSCVILFENFLFNPDPTLRYEQPKVKEKALNIP